MPKARPLGRRPAGPPPRHRLTRRSIAGLSAALICAGVLPATVASPALAADGQGFTLNTSDLQFIIKQIQIAERHAATRSDVEPCATLLGADPTQHQIPNQNAQGAELPWGLRTVDGTCNNLKPGQDDFGAADRIFPRRVAPPQFETGENSPGGFFPPANGSPSTYADPGVVYDSGPRTASNLIVDQTVNNPSAVAAAGEEAVPDESGTLFIPNVAPDVGLSAPFNSLFTLFGQFFDHGLDLVDKSGGSVFVPLRNDDPLVLGADGEFGTTDDLPPRLRFMVLTRATTESGPDAVNKTTPYVDQSQTYTSHPSHQVFLREYEPAVPEAAGDPAAVATGRMLIAPSSDAVNAPEGLATWGSTKEQAAEVLGIQLSDTMDLFNLPMLATDPYGQFIPGENGLPQIVTATGMVEGNVTTPVPVPADALRTGHAFLDDIAHHAVPFGDNDTNPGNAPGPRTADPDTVVSGDDRNNATYDDELLDSHFVAGDGRINENIGLTAVHHVFHSEHNRLVAEIGGMIAADTPEGAALRATWQPATAEDDDWAYGDRLFQAARFVTEMQYQHLAFEEFARKVQPQVNLFAGYDTGIDAAIPAEFAHAVYRFGHSMLTETVARRGSDGASDDIPLIDAFLNPPAFYEDGRTPEESVGDIVRGMTDQVGNEIDEFVTEALRNNLLGLPLDLATLNMARARETGVPSLNEARRTFHAQSNGNSALAPYANWIDFGLGLRHHDSLINFVAAYGTHVSITGNDAAGNPPAEPRTMAQRRAAAELLVSGLPADDGTPPPGDAIDFMNGEGAYANGGGLNDVDLWVGGLAEAQSPFGGLLGSTFNFIFETSMEDLQDGDRFYYLSRTAGLNLLVQLEGNSFAELISRNSDAENLPADVFSRPDLVFNLAAQNATGPIVNDTTTAIDERTVLTRMADGTIRYAGPLHVLFVGTPTADKVRASEGDDTLRGNEQRDRLEGGAGNDQFIGGSEDDILTDTFGDDVLKGGDNDDALFSGPGFDLNQGGLGNDFIVGGSDPTESFGGPGNDFIYAGDSSDTVFGDDGDDWLEGGGQADLVQGDNGAPFQDDPNTPGHDVLNGNGGQDDYDAEGGDDIMVSGPGIERNEGMLGFDWVTHKNDPQAADDDLNVTGLLPDSLDALRDRFDLVEALSGGNLNDTLRGDDAIDTDMVGHELNAAGIARIEGLAALLPAGATSFTGGNILIGGQGSDLLEGRGGDDLIDGDVWLNVRLQAPGAGLVDSMNSLQAAVSAGTLDPGSITIHRNVEMSGAGTFVDTAVFTGLRAEYTITPTANGVTVAHVGGTAVDGTDTLRNIERLRFADVTVSLAPTVTVAPIANATGLARTTNVTATFSEPVQGVTGTTFRLTGPGGVAIPAVVTINAANRVATLNPTPTLAAGTTYTATLTGGLTAIRSAAGFPLGTTSWSFTTAADSTAPIVNNNRTPAVNATGVGVATNIVAPFNEAVQGVSPTTFTLRQTVSGAAVAGAVTQNAAGTTWTLNPSANLASGRSYTVTLAGGPTAIRDLAGNPLGPTTWTFTTAVDRTAPTLNTRAPVPNATTVGVAANVTATFSEPVQGVTAATFALRVQGSTTVIPAAVTRDGTTNRYILNPNVNLARNTVYVVTLTGGPAAIRDLANNNALVTTTWTFRTVV